MRQVIRSGHAVTLALILAIGGCKSTAKPKGTTPPPSTPDAATSTANEATEWVNFQTTIPMQATDFDPLMSGMFGANAQAGQFLSQHLLSQSFWITTMADPATPNQTRLQFTYDDGSSTPRTLAETPASYAVGGIFVATVDAAVAQLQSDAASNNAQGEIFNLTYNVVSSQGGTLAFTVNGSGNPAGNQAQYSLTVQVTTPHTSLEIGQVGQAASTTAPYDYVSGTVWFQMLQDEFDYFVGHAYGQGATAGQNFSNFALVPYNWLRLTVTPDISENIVNVAFDVLEASGKTIPLAQAPASVMAGGTFQTLVDRAMYNMTSQEAAAPGSSTPWTIPFYYDQPSGGGVVQVIASGQTGVFTVAYSVASPTNALIDVPFVAYKPVSFPPSDGGATIACYDLGNPNITKAAQGVFQITFTASSVITNNLTSGQTLIGDIGCAVYNASDVTVTGPNPGAQQLDGFTLKNANLLATAAPTFTTTTALPDGSYQILCAQYVDGNDNDADKGDPVTLPIGGFDIACNINPVTLQFALLNPSNQ